MVDFWLEFSSLLVDDCLLLCPHIVRREQDRTTSPMALLIKALVPSRRFTLMTSSKPSYLPMAPSPNTVTLGVKVSTFKFGGDIIHSLAALFLNLNLAQLTVILSL